MIEFAILLSISNILFNKCKEIDLSSSKTFNREHETTYLSNIFLFNA